MTTETEEAPAVPDDLLAAEYVLGVLDAEQWRIAEERRTADPEFAARVAGWEQSLAGLADAVPSVPPPVRVHRRVEAELALLIARTPPPPEPEPEPLPPPGLPPEARFWRRMAIGGFGLAATVIAAGVAVFVTPPVGLRTLVPAMLDVTMIADREIDHILFFVSVDRRRHEVLLTPVGNIPADRVPELWFVPEAGAPRSLGVFSPSMPCVLPLPALPEGMPRGARLAVSLEPPGGSVTGAPTGQVVGQGRLSPTL